MRPSSVYPLPATTIKAPRIGIYQSCDPSMDEGWTRFVLISAEGRLAHAIDLADAALTDLTASPLPML